MRVRLGNIAAAVVTAALLTAAGVGTAYATTLQSDTPSASGSVLVPDNSNVTVGAITGTTGGGVHPLTVQNVGGGTWNYGSQFTIFPGKTCWSNYVHNGKYHSATTIMGNVNQRIYANAGNWADSGASGGIIYTCYAYWATY